MYLEGSDKIIQNFAKEGKWCNPYDQNYTIFLSCCLMNLHKSEGLSNFFIYISLLHYAYIQNNIRHLETDALLSLYRDKQHIVPCDELHLYN